MWSAPAKNMKKINMSISFVYNVSIRGNCENAVFTFLPFYKQNMTQVIWTMFLPHKTGKELIATTKTGWRYVIGWLLLKQQFWYLFIWKGKILTFDFRD